MKTTATKSDVQLCDPATESFEMDLPDEKPILNGISCERRSRKSDCDGQSSDPWIERDPTSLVPYYCVKNEYSSQTSPQRNISICLNCRVSMKSKSVPTKDTLIQPPNSIQTSPVSRSKSREIIQHFRKFCETTSLRGVPRIINSRRCKYRFLFTVFVLFFFVANFTCLFLLIKQYRERDVIHQPKTSYNNPSDFPSITFCNLRPFSSRTVEYLKENKMKTLTEFLKSFKPLFRNTMKSLHINPNSEMALLTSTATSLNQFLMNLPPSVDISSIGHSLKSMVLECTVSYINGSELSGTKCDKAGKWIITKNEVYLNCHTLTLDAAFLKNAKAVDITLHLDDRFDFNCSDCMPNFPLYHMTGIRFNLHTAHTYPNVLNEGINLSPGTFTEAVFNSKEWNMMEPPYGKCSKDLMNIKYEFEEGDFLYTMPSCKEYTIQQSLSKSCNCTKYNYLPRNLMHINKDKDECTFVEMSVFQNATDLTLSKESLDRFINRVKCRKEVSYLFNDDYSTCTVPCQSYTFETSISSGIYPTKSYHLQFYKVVSSILKRSIAETTSKTERKELATILDKLKIYEDINKELKQNNLAVAEKMLKEANVIEKNFLTIQINRQHLNIVKVEEKAVVSITSLLSQAGGMFSIWSGITFFIIVEFIELSMKIFETVFEIEI